MQIIKFSRSLNVNFSYDAHFYCVINMNRKQLWAIYIFVLPALQFSGNTTNNINMMLSKI